MQKIILVLLMTIAIFTLFRSWIKADESHSLKVGDKAPLFTLPNQMGTLFNLKDRADHGWTVLYFYPKAGTPGCTKEACAFRDAIKSIRAQGAEVYGISGDTTAQQKEFHEKHHLLFDLLADPDAKVITEYGAKEPLLKIAKRWTFILDPKLNIRWIETNVDPMVDAKIVASKLVELQGGHP